MSSKITEHDLADELMLPVQNGGLYINSETTEEDKHEARDMLHAIGLVELLDYRSSEYDMDEVIRSGNHFAFYYTNVDTLGTPYNKGAAVYAEALILSFAYGNTFGFQIAYFTGGQSMMRSLRNSVLSDWTTGFLPLDGSVPMSGSLGIANNLGGFYADINGVLVNQYETKSDFYNRRGVWVHSKSHADLTHALQFFIIENGADKLYNIFGEHNKPSGSYTGNCSATSRTIDVGIGLGNVLFIEGGSFFGFVGYNGGTFFDFSKSNGYAYGFDSSAINYREGVLTIANSSNLFNKSGTIFNYKLM